VGALDKGALVFLEDSLAATARLAVAKPCLADYTRHAPAGITTAEERLGRQWFSAAAVATCRLLDYLAVRRLRSRQSRLGFD
jgi:hypothetical protein